MNMDIKTIDPIGADPDTGTADTNAPIDLLGLSRDEMCEALIAAGIPDRQAKMRTAQLWRWIYHHGHQSFDSMTNVAKNLRQDMARRFRISRPEVAKLQNPQVHAVVHVGKPPHDVAQALCLVL